MVMLLLVNGTVFTIDKSNATLDKVAFISTVRVSTQHGAAYVNLSEPCPTNSLLPERAMVILSRKSIMVVIQSWFEGNIVGLGRVIENRDSDTTILNTTFAKNSAATHCYNNCCFTGGLVYSSSSQGNYVKIYDNNFVQNVGVMVFTLTNKLNMLISCSKFINNSAPIMMVFATDTNSLQLKLLVTMYSSTLMNQSCKPRIQRVVWS